MKKLLLLSIVLLLSGCTVGRFVTNVSSNGPGKISVEKCTTLAYGNFYWNTECSETQLTVSQPNK